MQSNATMSGCLAVVWIPMSDTITTAALLTGDLATLSINNHTLLFAGADRDLRTEAPFDFEAERLDLRNDANPVGTFAIVVLSALRTGDGAPATVCTLSVYASFFNSEFNVINPTTVTAVPQGGGFSKLGKNIDSIVEASVDAVNTVGDMANSLDRPNVGVNPPLIGLSEYPKFTNSTTIDYSTNLALDQGDMLPQGSMQTSRLVDEMDFKYLLSKPCWIETVTLSTDNTVNEAIGIWDLCPGFELFNVPQGTTLTLSLLSYLSLPMSYWKGSLIFNFIIPATASHVAKLVFCTHYGYEASGLSVDEALGQQTTEVEVKGVTSFAIKVPWRSTTPLKKVNNGSNTNTADYSCGQVSLRVLNPLQNTELTSSTIDVMVYVSAGEDFELAVLGNNAVDFQVQPA